MILLGLVESIKDVYFSWEEKYYNFLDKVNESVPVYSIVDPVDKVIPSFILVLALFFVILALILGTILGGVALFTNDTFTVSVQETNGDPLGGASVTFIRDGDILATQTTDELGITKVTGILVDDEIEIRVEKDDYIIFTNTYFIFELPQAEDVFLEKESEAFTFKTIRLVDDLGQPIRDNFTLRFRCSNPYAPPIQDRHITAGDNGTTTVRVANNCDRLTVDVLNSNKFKEVNGKIIISDDETIFLDAEDASKGEIIVNISDAQGNPIDGIQVELYKYSELLDNPNVGPLTVDFTFSGQASFETFPGSYTIKTYDSSGNYAEGSSPRISLGADSIETVSLTLREDIKGQIKIRVKDKTNGSAIENASVKLFFAETNEELTTIDSDAEGEAEFNISKSVEYNVITAAEGYQLGRIAGLRISDEFVEISLEKCTPTTCGSLKVKIVDQDGTAINNATVVLYNASTNFISGYNNRISDINGVAEFFNISSGNYYAFAFKEGFSGRSDTGYFTSAPTDNEGINLTVTMEIGDGIVRVNVKDKEGRAISFATIGIFDARNDALIGNDITGVDGVKEVTLRANKTVYLIVSKEDSEAVFTKYVTIKKPLIVETVQEFDVIMEKPFINKDIEIEFLGLYLDGLQAQNIRAGDTYKARFKVRVPEDKDYDEMGFHIRTGQDVLMEKDELFIKEVNAPNTSQIRATRFESERSGLDEDDYQLTNADAKWVNLVWDATEQRGILAGVYEVEAEIEIKDSASLGDKLFMNYRVWGEGNDGRERFPSDDTITLELYSNTLQEIFQVGIITLCDENFCFTSTITDLEEDIIQSVTDSYSARIFNPYKLQFVITNNAGETIHNSANLRIVNFDESIKFFNYTLTDAQTRTTTGTVNGFEFPRQDVGNLSPNNSVRLETEFTPQNSINGIVNIQLVSDQVIVFEKNLTIIVGAPRELALDIEPNFYLSGIQNDIEVTVTDRADNLEVEEAIVRLKDKRGNILDWDITGLDGKAFLTLPGQKPGTVLEIEAEKINYNVKVVEVSVSDELLRITPSQLGVSLNTQKVTETETKFSIRNVAPYDLSIKDIQLQGNFKNLIDKQAVRNWLEASYKGMLIRSEEKQDLVLKTFLSEDAQALKERIDLEGELIIIVGNFGQEWVFEIPVKIAIGLGDDVDDPTCLVVTRSEWIASTSGTPKRTEFQIQNNCTVDGKPVALRDLEAKIDWKSNQLGEFTLNFGQDEVTLRSGYFRLMLGSLQPEQTVNAILSFTPYGGVNGVAVAEIVIQATNPLDAEDQILVNTLKTEITTVNIAQCISYTPERLVIKPGQDSGILTITADEICGETLNFEIESELATSPRDSFDLQAGKTQEIQVFVEDNNPGQYGVLLSPKFSSSRKEQLVKNLRVIIERPGCWQLSKYEFDVYDDPNNNFDGFDVANLTNNCVEKSVEVRVNTKDFMDALQDGLFFGLAAFGASMLTNVGDEDTDLFGRSTDDEDDSSSRSSSSDTINLTPSGSDRRITGTETSSSGIYRVGSYKTNDKQVYYDSKSKDYYTTDTESLGTRIIVEWDSSTNSFELEANTAADNQFYNSIPPIQGLITHSRSSGGGLLSGGFGGIISNIFSSPWASGVTGTVAGTLFSYMTQDDETSFTILADDVELEDVSLILGAGSSQVIDNEIDLVVEGLGDDEQAPVVPQPLVNQPDLLSLGIENFRTIFNNATGFTTTEERPKYSELLVTGIRHVYSDKTYDKDDFFDDTGGFLGFFDSDSLDKEKTALEEETPQKLEQRFNLEFNSVPPQIETPEQFGLLNCQAGTKIGSTGFEALPKTKLAWNWSDIDEDSCNEDNLNGIYCDGTQFSIALLEKINDIQKYVSTNGPGFSCPSPREDAPATNDIGSFDIGVLSVGVSRNGTDIEIIAEIENTNPGIIDTKVTIQAVSSTQGTVECDEGTQEISVSAGGREEVRCTFTDLEEAFYDAEVIIIPSVGCENCEDLQATNRLSRTFFAGEFGLAQCEPYSTSRLDLFLQASGITDGEANSIVDKTRFNALLMVDGYSTDFQQDFDVAQNQTFFDAPDYYKDQTNGLGIYFRDPGIFNFDAYSQPDFTLPGPGTYNVVIDIEYDNENWELFDSEGNPSAVISIKMEKLHGADPDSPFYYIPFDGLVGQDSGRVGYGINFGGDSIIIDNSNEPLRTVEIAGSSPINDGVLQVTDSDSFKGMQVDNRGVVAKLTRGNGNPTLLMQPSHATPVILRIDKESNGEAYAIYQVEVDNGAADLGPTMALWSGIGVTCKAFDDATMSQQQFVPDTHGISARCALVGQNERTKYALEFCQDPINFGSVFYETVFYTPQDSTSLIQLVDASSDSAIFIAAGETGDDIFLSGNGVTNRINTLQDVFDLVENEFICIQGTNLNAEFFWNPKKIFDTIQDKENDAINACITS